MSRRYRWTKGEVVKRTTAYPLTDLMRKRLISPHDFWEGIAKLYSDDKHKLPFFPKRGS